MGHASPHVDPMAPETNNWIVSGSNMFEGVAIVCGLWEAVGLQ
jgi:hypothetical protein